MINVISARANALLQAQDPVQKEKGKKIIDAINALKIAIAEDATFDRAKIISQFANDPQILNTDAKKLEQADSLMFSQMKSVFNVVGVERYAQYDTQADFFDDRVISKKVKTQFAHVCKELAAHRNTGYLASIARFFGFNTHTTSLNEVKQQVPQL